MKALDMIAALRPRHVVAGHKNKALEDNPKTIDETRRYPEDADRLIDISHTALEFYNGMMELYPDRLNPSTLWFGVRKYCSTRRSTVIRPDFLGRPRIRIRGQGRRDGPLIQQQICLGIEVKDQSVVLAGLPRSTTRFRRVRRPVGRPYPLVGCAPANSP
jgi:hypothetical protein